MNSVPTSSPARWILLGIAIGIGLIAGAHFIYTTGQHSVQPVVAAADSLPRGTVLAPRAVTTAHRSEPVPQPEPAAPIDPVMGWKERVHSSLVMTAGQLRIGGQPGYSARLKIEAKSTQPITFGFVLDAWTQLLNQGKMTPAKSLTGMPCVQISVTDTTIECDFVKSDAEVHFLIADDRINSGVNTLAAAGLAYLGVKGPAEQVTAQNTVTVIMSEWTCVDHCAK